MVLLRSLLLFTVLVSACKGDEAPSPPSIAEAEAIVTRWYQAVEAGDCKTILAITADKMTQENCDGLITDFREHGAKFLGVAEAKLDGRDKQAVLVTARLSFTNRYGSDKKWITRAVRTSDGWRVHSP